MRQSRASEGQEKGKESVAHDIKLAERGAISMFLRNEKRAPRVLVYLGKGFTRRKILNGSDR